jgi:hypothetical protein
MKRKIELITSHIRVTATIDNKRRALTRDEVERVRDELADDLMRAVSRVQWLGAPLSRVQVK